MTSRYRAQPEIKFKGYRDLEKRRIEASDTLWALLVGSKLAVKTLADVPDQRTLLANEYPTLPHVARMNQRLDRAGRLLDGAERELCTMALNFTFGLHEDFLRSCIGLLVPLGIASKAAANANADSLHENFESATGHPVDPDALALFHLTRKIRNAHTHAAGAVRAGLVAHYESLTTTQRETWAYLTSEAFRVPSVGESAAVGVSGLIASLAVQKRLAYDVNVGLQSSIPRDTWADMATREYFEESGKSPRDPSALRSLRGYLRGGYTPLTLSDHELGAAIERKKSGTL